MNSYMQELLTDIIANNESNLDIKVALTRAHGRRKAFAAEMVAGESMRSKIFSHTLMTDVYNSISSDELMNKSLSACEEIYNT